MKPTNVGFLKIVPEMYPESRNAYSFFSAKVYTIADQWGEAVLSPLLKIEFMYCILKLAPDKLKQ